MTSQAINYNYNNPTPEQQQWRQAWRKYCSLENLSQQDCMQDVMHCVMCGAEFVTRHLNDSGFCPLCCGKVYFGAKS